MEKVSTAGAAAVRPATSHSPHGDSPAAAALRPPKRSFVARWFGSTRVLVDAPAMAPAPSRDELAKVLRPVRTGWLRAFFTGYRGLSDAQLTLARQRHDASRPSGAVGVPGAATLPAALAQALARHAKGKPDAIFEAVLGQVGASPSCDLATQGRAFLLSMDQGQALSVLAKAFASRPGTSDKARAQAVYAALVAGIDLSPPAVPGPKTPAQALGARLDAMTGSGESLLTRAKEFKAIHDELQTTPGMDAFTRVDLQQRCNTMRESLGVELLQAMQDQRDALEQQALGAASDSIKTQQALWIQMQEAHALLATEAPSAQQAKREEVFHQWQAVIDQVVDASDNLADYGRITVIGPDNARVYPCAELDAWMRQQPLAQYQQVQGQIDAICAKVRPWQRDDLLAAIGQGIRGDRGGQPKVGLVGELLEGHREAIEPILGSEWDDLALSLMNDAWEQRRDEALQAAPELNRPALDAQFDKERFAIHVAHHRRIANREINRMLLARAPHLAADLVGAAGHSPGATQEALAVIRQAGKGMDKSADLLIYNWIRLSCLDPASGRLDQARAVSLCISLYGHAPDPAVVQGYFTAGFTSTESVARCKGLIASIARNIAKAEALAQASHEQDPRAWGRGVMMRVHQQATGEPGVDPSDARFAAMMQELAQTVTAQWAQGAGGDYASLIADRGSRTALFSQLAKPPALLSFVRDSMGGLAAPRDATAQSQADQLAKVVGYLELAQRLGKAKTAPEKQKLQAQLNARRRDLAGIGFLASRFKLDAEQEPAQIQMQALLPVLPALRDLQRLDRLIASRQKSVLSQANPAEAGLRATFEAAVRIAATQEALDPQKPPKAATPAAGAVLRLKALGFDPDSEDPKVRQLVGDLRQRMQGDGLALARVCARSDPLAQDAPGFMQSGLPVQSRASETLATAKEKRRKENQAAVVQRLKDLAPGNGFDIRFGKEVVVSGSHPVVPGVGVGVESGVRKFEGLQVRCVDADHYEVEISANLRSSFAASLSLMQGWLTLGGGYGRESGQGFVFKMEKRPPPAKAPAALTGEFVQGLLDPDEMDPTLWDQVRVEETGVRESKAQAAAKFSADLSLPGDLSLASLEAELAVAAGVRRELRSSAYQDVETVSRRVAVSARGAAAIAGGMAGGEKEAGVDVAVSRTTVRRDDRLREGSGVSVRSVVVADEVAAALRRVLPGLGGEQTEALMAQVESLTLGGEGVGEQERAIELVCELTSQARSLANQWRDVARAHVQAATRRRAVDTVGAAREARAAREAMAQSEAVLRDPASFEPKSLSLVITSRAEARSGLTQRKAVATVAAQRAVPLALPADATAAMLGTAYGRILGAAG